MRALKLAVVALLLLEATRAVAMTGDGMIVLTRRLYDTSDATNIVAVQSARVPYLVHLLGADDAPYPLEGRRVQLIVAHREYPFLTVLVQTMVIVPTSAVYALTRLDLPPGVYGARVRVIEMTSTNIVAEFGLHDTITILQPPSALTIALTNTVTNTVTLTNIVNNTNAVTVVNTNQLTINITNIGAALSIGYRDATSTPQFLRLHGGGAIATGAQDGANLELYLPAGWTNLVLEGAGNVITNAAATASTLTLQRGTVVDTPSSGGASIEPFAVTARIDGAAIVYTTAPRRMGLYVGTNFSLSAQLPDNTAIGGAARGAWATDWQRARVASNQIASGDYSTIGGGQNNRADGLYSVVAGGRENRVSGHQSFIGCGYMHQALAGDSAIGGGQNNYLGVNSAQSAILGGQNNTIDVAVGAHLNAIVGGDFNEIKGANSGEYGVTGARNGIFVGYYCLLDAAPQAFIGVGHRNAITNSQYAAIGGGYWVSNNNARLTFVGVGGGVRFHGVTNGFVGAAVNSAVLNARNAAIIVGESLTNSTSDTALAPAMLFPIRTNLPAAVQNNYVIETWFRESATSAVKYAIGLLNGVGFTSEIRRINL